MADVVGRVAEGLNLMVAGGEARRGSFRPMEFRAAGDWARTGWLEGGGVMLVENGTGEAREVFIVSLRADLGLFGGGVEGTFISKL